MVVNLIFGLSSQWWLLLLLWALNGWVQADGAGDPHCGSRTGSRLASGPDSTGFGTSFVAGNAITWLLTGWLVGWFGWRAAL